MVDAALTLSALLQVYDVLELALDEPHDPVYAGAATELVDVAQPVDSGPQGVSVTVEDSASEEEPQPDAEEEEEADQVPV